jgi:hypothetical protein
MPRATILDASGGCALFGRIVFGVVVRQLRLSGVGQTSSRIEADEIGAGGLGERNNEAMCSGDEEQKHSDLDRKQGPATGENTTTVEPIFQIAEKAHPQRRHSLSTFWRLAKQPDEDQATGGDSGLRELGKD